MSDPLLHIVQKLSSALTAYNYDKGEIAGRIMLNEQVIAELITLADNGIVDDRISVNGSSMPLRKINAENRNAEVPVVIYSHLLRDSRYYHSFAEFVAFNQYAINYSDYYIRELDYFSHAPDIPMVIQEHRKVLEFITLLESVADYVRDELNVRIFIFFSRQKVEVAVNYHANHIRDLTHLHDLEKQLTIDYDKVERQAVYKNELVSFLLPENREHRFSKLLNGFDQVYFNYSQSHLLYLQKFSYNDLKNRLDEDRLSYTKKIYGVVNDIQSKLIAVPAAYLLVLAQFDYAHAWSARNVLMLIGAVLFSVILEILLTNQFGVLNYLKREIDEFTGRFVTKAEAVDVSAFTADLSQLTPLIRRQKNYLWIFRGIVWLVPVTVIIMLVLFR